MAGRKNCASGNRSKPKKGLNRYNPGAPSYLAVHGPDFLRQRPVLSPLSPFAPMQSTLSPAVPFATVNVAG
jgi:hypothetical protein